MLASSHAFCACHWSGEFGPADEISSLWVGREVLEELLTAGSAPFAFNQQAAEMVDTRLEFVREGTLDIAVDGKATSLPVVIARAEQATFWIHNDPDDPLVLQVRGLWSSTVTSILQRADDHIGTMLEIYAAGFITSTAVKGTRCSFSTAGPAWSSTTSCPTSTGSRPTPASSTSTSPATDYQSATPPASATP